MKTISQSDLRDHSDAILAQVESGERFTVTVDGRPVARLEPCPQRQWVPKEELLKILRTSPLDPAFFEDIQSLEEGTPDPLEPRE
ncbi:MAG TPA: type II toxin-antitoxin system prevent-host-death family antitoxin [Thermoanaerobaculia bacterium]|nr:type II toxin-antitoxin system prevent-host-death family antitoxin [Thermoanaerobaculia bacterium]